MKKILIVGGKKSAKELANNIIQMLLPLDVDMQTLEILRQNGGDMEEFLREMYSDRIDYPRKFQVFTEKVNKLLLIPDSDINSILLNEIALAPSVESFFLKLSQQAEAKDLFQYDWDIEYINSFHDWYCALSNTLNGGRKE